MRSNVISHFRQRVNFINSKEVCQPFSYEKIAQIESYSIQEVVHTKKAVGIDRFFSYINSEVITFKMLCLYSCLLGRHKVQAKQFAIFHTLCYQIISNNRFFSTVYTFTPTVTLLFVQLGFIHANSNISQMYRDKSYLYTENTETARTK